MQRARGMHRSERGEERHDVFPGHPRKLGTLTPTARHSQGVFVPSAIFMVTSACFSLPESKSFALWRQDISSGRSVAHSRSRGDRPALKYWTALSCSRIFFHLLRRFPRVSFLLSFSHPTRTTLSVSVNRLLASRFSSCHATTNLQQPSRFKSCRAKPPSIHAAHTVTNFFPRTLFSLLFFFYSFGSLRFPKLFRILAVVTFSRCPGSPLVDVWLVLDSTPT